ncbi:endonuclease/exonuclease/phosphatase family protein [uncultured Muribaculum sp.]|uniref:endonuclease/exonuclease/phosphatase family protein n=1 Tax=uncultured Muribaculum sp. TaxID=1918613 RepID=UPI002600A8EB|nr:endonuclease/exonuclease/phosphatase family protein [uncultured Muribaculum sp.]
MMKAKYLLPLSLFFVSATACGSDDDDAVASSSEVPGTPMKVMSYNIRYSNTIDLGDTSWDARRQPSIDMIRDENPDIIGLQEPRPDQREDLVAGLGDVYTLYCAVDNGVADNRTGHTAIMYRTDRFTVLDKGHFWLSPTPDEESRPAWGAEDTQFRTTVWLHLYDNVAKKELYFFNTHLPYKSADITARTESVKLNVSRMKEKAGRSMPVFITGDMNCSYYSTDERRVSLEPYHEWMWAARDEAVNLNPESYSFNGFGDGTPAPRWNLDHIFYRKVTPLEFKVVDSDKYGVKYVSDHYPITLTLKY